jgi:hypothetical protein
MVAGMLIATALAAQAIAASPAASSTAAAPLPDSYLCDHTTAGSKTRAWGYGNCVAPVGIRSEFIIRSRTAGEKSFLCTDRAPANQPFGVSELPRRVSGFYCSPSNAGQ